VKTDAQTILQEQASKTKTVVENSDLIPFQRWTLISACAITGM